MGETIKRKDKKKSQICLVLYTTMLLLVILCVCKSSMLYIHKKHVVVTRNSFALSSKNIPTMKSKRKTALFVSWTKCHHCTRFESDWKQFEEDSVGSGDILKVALDSGEPEANEAVKWLLTTPVFEGSFPTILGFPAGGGEATVYNGPREVKSLKAWFASI